MENSIMAPHTDRRAVPACRRLSGSAASRDVRPAAVRCSGRTGSAFSMEEKWRDSLWISPAAASASSFTDVAASAYYASAVNWAVENNVTNGTSTTTFSPNADCTRAQIVTFLYRAMAK